MLDVHPPEHGIHGTRDFFTHLATITVGLLIALALEAGVEAIHHGHQRHEAERLILQELRQNSDDVLHNDSKLKSERTNMLATFNFLEAHLHHTLPPSTSLSIDFSATLLHDAAFRSAAATGALSYMDYTEVQQFSGAYKEQDLYEAIEHQTLEDYLELDAFVANGFNPESVSDDDVKAALPIVRHAIAHLEGMAAASAGLRRDYDDVLKR